MTKNIKKLIIIGGTGFIGYHVAKEAKKRKWTFKNISINKTKKIRRISKVKYIHLDISKKNQLKNKIADKRAKLDSYSDFADSDSRVISELKARRAEWDQEEKSVQSE